MRHNFFKALPEASKWLAQSAASDETVFERLKKAEIMRQQLKTERQKLQGIKDG